ncbi:MAG: hypothetical protein IH988_00095 [Planctomycetes bacterium]|nr:hypothetical protein [Planctomycetota bacterium]
MRNLMTLFAILAMSLLIAGCPDSGGTGNDNDSMMNDNVPDDMNDNDDGDMDGGSTTLSTVLFEGDDVALGVDPDPYDIGGGSISFMSGRVGTVGIQPLYGEGVSSWNVLPENSPSTITFSDLAVSGLSFYFAHFGSTGGTITAQDAGGAVIGDPIASVATITLGDPAGFLNLEAPADVTIATLTIEFNDGAGAGDVVALDTMTLTVAGN